MSDKPSPRTAASRRNILHNATAATLELWDLSPARGPDFDAVAARAGVTPEDLAKVIPDAAALMALIIENGLATLTDHCRRAVVQVDPDRPVDQFQALGQAYLEWVMAEPRLFRVMTAGPADGSAAALALRRQSMAIRDLMARLLQRAKTLGHLRMDADVDLIVLQGRAFAYGLARLLADGRLEEFYPDNPSPQVVLRAMDSFVRDTARQMAPGSETGS